LAAGGGGAAGRGEHNASWLRSACYVAPWPAAAAAAAAARMERRVGVGAMLEEEEGRRVELIG